MTQLQSKDFIFFSKYFTMVYELKTQLTDASVREFINAIEDETKREDCLKLLDMFTRVTGEQPKMWWSAIIGFGTYHYKYASGQEWDWMRTGFWPRKTGLSVYIMPGYDFDNMQELLWKLGKFKNGKSCLNIKRLEDIDIQVLEQMVIKGLDTMKKMYP